MKIYIAHHEASNVGGPWSTGSCIILGAFSSRELAEALPTGISLEYEIIEVELDECDD